MHNKNNSKTKSYIQGLRPFSTSIPKTLKKYLKKGGYNYSNIVDNWTRLVSKNISDVCYPITVKMGKEMRDGTLILSVTHGKEIEIEYEKKNIIDKVNNFFGYNCINNISLKVAQNKIITKQKNLNKIKDFDKIAKKMKEIKNDQLKKSLNNFLKAYNGKNE